jgi:hypothetical protein
VDVTMAVNVRQRTQDLHSHTQSHVLSDCSAARQGCEVHCETRLAQHLPAPHSGLKMLSSQPLCAGGSISYGHASCCRSWQESHTAGLCC